jgi:hypothetical protein
MYTDFTTQYEFYNALIQACGIDGNGRLTGLYHKPEYHIRENVRSWKTITPVTDTSAESWVDISSRAVHEASIRYRFLSTGYRVLFLDEGRRCLNKLTTL